MVINMDKSYRTSESVTEGHPDKICDIVSDALVDLFLGIDRDALVSVKALATKDLICIDGELAGYKCCELDIETTIRDAVRDIGYDTDEYGFNADTLQIIDKIDRHDINDSNKLKWKEGDLLGSRDQGIVFGYACNEKTSQAPNETIEFMPLPITLAHKLAQGLTNLRKSGTLNYLRPDGKTQVTIEYEQGIPRRAETVVISTLHSIDVSGKQLEKDLRELLIVPILGSLYDERTTIHINPTGRFIVGGPAIDTGLTGRKIIVDTYGEASRHGGGAFSGKDPTSSDRCGAYLARYIAKNVVASELAKECEIELAYAIGGFVPIHITVDTNNTGILSDRNLERVIENNFDLSITGAITTLQLRRPIYKQTASYGHFGRPEFPWERLDKTEQLREVLKHVQR